MIRQSVLVVEDEEDIRELVSYNLLKEGYQVAGVASGEDALTAVESKTPDLILLDIMLPGLDGLRVCRKLKENPKYESIPIVKLTAKGEEPDIAAGRRGNQHLRKRLTRGHHRARSRDDNGPRRQHALRRNG